MVLVVAHDLGTDLGSESLEPGAESFVVDVAAEVLDVHDVTLIFAQLLHLGLFGRLPRFFLTFRCARVLE